MRSAWPSKDLTDLELALGAVIDRGATRVVVVGGHGGRLDHLLANVALLASDRYASLEITALMDEAKLFVVRRSVRITGSPGDLVSLLAVGGDAVVSTEGLRFPLSSERLPAAVGRGISNELVGDRAEVSVAEGVVLVVQPLDQAV
jgi:thiamine pyrophosphokinase